MKLQRCSVKRLRVGQEVKWKACGHSGWWKVAFVSADGHYARLERGGVSQFVPIAALREQAR